MAHTLALLAVARGERNATWIASAALDRYLKSVGQPQIYGTQYFKDPKSGWTQNPMEETLVNDRMRLIVTSSSSWRSIAPRLKSDSCGNV